MKKVMLKWFFILSIVCVFVGVASLAGIYFWYSKGLPEVSSIDDYDPKKISKVFDRKGKVIGEFFNVEKRELIPEEDIPDFVEQAFMSAEDSDFYSHNGVNPQAILRAAIKNFMAGRTVQGGSTITQQVVKKIFLTDERSIERKIKEAILALRLERKYSKERILNLYLNHIYLGEGAYGIEMAAQTYFRKSAKDLEIKEAALLAGLTNRPSKNSPLRNPKAAKRRQRYVLFRLAEEGYITREQAEEAVNENLKVYFSKKIELKAPYFVETLRQILSEKLGDKALLQEGLKITTSLDLEAQQAAQKAVKKGLRDLDKRQGFRGALKNLTEASEVQKFLKETRDNQIKKHFGYIEVTPEGEVAGKLSDPLNLTVSKIDSETEKKENLPEYLVPGDLTKAIVTRISNREKLAFVRFGEYRAIITLESMAWARKLNPSVSFKYDQLKKISRALRKGDVIDVRIVAKKITDKKILSIKTVDHIESYAVVELEQEPIVQGALLSFDQETGEIIAMVGGYDFEKSKYNRTYQSLRQTGSAFKPLVYAAALDYGLQPTSEILDIPMVFEDQVNAKGETYKYKPSNHSRDFSGDVLLRDALVRSMNVPTVQIIHKIGVPWSLTYAKRLGIFSTLNEDITAALGSSGLSLYELTKAYSHFGRLGKKIHPILIKSVEDINGTSLLTDYSFDEKFEEKIKKSESEFKESVFEKLQFGDQSDIFSESNDEQLISRQTAYIITNILHDVIYGSRGTAGTARALNRPAAGKTGSTSDYFDALFMGYTPQIATGVWVGFDNERTLGRGEVGGRSALPIWTDYMLKAHKNLPKKDFKIPSGIVFSNIDLRTGKLATASSKRVARQAFRRDFQLNEEDAKVKNNVDEKDLFQEDLEDL